MIHCNRDWIALLVTLAATLPLSTPAFTVCNGSPSIFTVTAFCTSVQLEVVPLLLWPYAIALECVPTVGSVPAALTIPLKKSLGTSVIVSSALYTLPSGPVSLCAGKDTFLAWIITAVDVMVLPTMVTTVDELVGGSALTLTHILGVVLLLTGPLMAAVTLVTASQPHVDILLTGLCAMCACFCLFDTLDFYATEHLQLCTTSGPSHCLYITRTPHLLVILLTTLEHAGKQDHWCTHTCQDIRDMLVEPQICRYTNTLAMTSETCWWSHRFTGTPTHLLGP